jgi:hypothetical protein
MDYSYDRRVPQRLYPWWLILVGFVFGVIATLIFTAPRWQPTVVYRYADDNAIWMQATTMVQQATLAASGYTGFQPPFDAYQATMAANDAMFQPPVDPIFATATAFIEQATARAGGYDAALLESDPFALTATAIVAQATPMTPGS